MTQGYDFRTREAYEQTMTSFGETVGFKYLKALHLNDSKGAFESHRDLHENIGMGNLGLMAFALYVSFILIEFNGNKIDQA